MDIFWGNRLYIVFSLLITVICKARCLLQAFVDIHRIEKFGSNNNVGENVPLPENFQGITSDKSKNYSKIKTETRSEVSTFFYLCNTYRRLPTINNELYKTDAKWGLRRAAYALETSGCEFNNKFRVVFFIFINSFIRFGFRFPVCRI